MARQLKHLFEAPRVCSYLPDATASLEHRLLLDVEPRELDHLLERGFRRFGADYFRPACPGCSACVPTRIVVAELAPTKSQRRALRKASSLRVTVDTPRVDAERLELYRRWHENREAVREWQPSELDARDYGLQFAFPHPCAREVTFRDDEAGGRLVGVSICDEAPRAWSLVYFFFDPAYASRSLGIANVLIGVQIAATRGIPYVYLGYAVAGCPSLLYKSGFDPREVLEGWPGLDEAPRWVRAPRRG